MTFGDSGLAFEAFGQTSKKEGAEKLGTQAIYRSLPPFKQNLVPLEISSSEEEVFAYPSLPEGWLNSSGSSHRPQAIMKKPRHLPFRPKTQLYIA